jgi:hypothetical protein
MKRFLASLSCTFLSAAFVLCQTSASMSSGPNGSHGTMHFGASFSDGATIIGAPFSVEEVDENVQTLADGTHIRQTFPGIKRYRDSMGRTRTERQPFRGMVGRNATMPEGPTIVEINDPVAHVRYVFALGEPVAHRQQLPIDPPAQAQPVQAVPAQPVSLATPVQPAIGALGLANSPDNNALKTVPSEKKCPVVPPTQQSAADESLPQTTIENLGTQIIEGIPAEGTRNSTTWPVGSVGNDRPITTSTESWTSPDLKEVILTKLKDPRNGDHIHKLMNISRSEPDPSLFEPPASSTVKSEEGEFTLNWSSTR